MGNDARRRASGGAAGGGGRLWAPRIVCRNCPLRIKIANCFLPLLLASPTEFCPLLTGRRGQGGEPCRRQEAAGAPHHGVSGLALEFSGTLAAFPPSRISRRPQEGGMLYRCTLLCCVSSKTWERAEAPLSRNKHTHTSLWMRFIELLNLTHFQAEKTLP